MGGRYSLYKPFSPQNRFHILKTANSTLKQVWYYSCCVNNDFMSVVYIIENMKKMFRCWEVKE